MTLLIDTCALINLANGAVIETVLDLPNSRILIPAAVFKEARSIRSTLKKYLSEGRIELFDENRISASEFLRIKGAYNLGEGESACICAAATSGDELVLDDLAARRASIDEGLENQLTGSIGLLQKCVQSNLISQESAFGAYESMIRSGAYLPAMTVDQMFN